MFIRDFTQCPFNNIREIIQVPPPVETGAECLEREASELEAQIAAAESEGMATQDGPHIGCTGRLCRDQ